MYHGFVIIDKPAGMTSHDVVARLRRISGQKQVGHAGTLDPAATGVLVVALGHATRLIEYAQDETSKQYRAVIELGVVTDTDDADGVIRQHAQVPEFSMAQLEALVAPFRGASAQVPPMYSALHHQGKRLYELARAGQEVERAPRPVVIDRLDIVDWTTPLLTLDVECSKGTYIRSLARDIGEAAGCGGHLKALRRTAVGPFQAQEAMPLARLRPDAAPHQPGDESVALSEALKPPDIAIAHWPKAMLDDQQAMRVRNGMTVSLDTLPAGANRARAHSADGTLLALLERRDDQWQPIKVFHW